MDSPWTYRARVKRIVDGDTVYCTVDLGFHVTMDVEVRINGIDTAETYGVSHESDEYQLGKEQERFVEEFLDAGNGEWPLRLKTEEEQGAYGRWLGDLYVDGESLSEAVLEKWPEYDY